MTAEPRTDRSESFGEALLGAVLDRAHELPPHLIGPLVADVVERLGAAARRSCCRTTANCGSYPYPARASWTESRR